MSIAAKCICGESLYYCVGKGKCPYAGKTEMEFFIENKCTEEEMNKCRAFLFAMRNKDINWHVLESVIRKYEDLLFHPPKTSNP